MRPSTQNNTGAAQRPVKLRTGMLACKKGTQYLAEMGLKRRQQIDAVEEEEQSKCTICKR